MVLSQRADGRNVRGKFVMTPALGKCFCLRLEPDSPCSKAMIPLTIFTRIIISICYYRLHCVYHYSFQLFRSRVRPAHSPFHSLNGMQLPSTEFM